MTERSRVSTLESDGMRAPGRTESTPLILEERGESVL